MPAKPRWSQQEVALLIALLERTRGSPTLTDLELLREQLLELADPAYRVDPSYRSVDSIRSQLTWVRDLAWDRPRAREAPNAFKEAWARHIGEAPSVEQVPPSNGAAVDRRELVRILGIVRATLTELVESPDYLPAALSKSYASAWKDLEARGYIDAAIAALHGPAVDDLLAAHGLVGPQRAAKTESVDEALRERRRRRGRGAAQGATRIPRLDTRQSDRRLPVARRDLGIQGDLRSQRRARGRGHSRRPRLAVMQAFLASTNAGAGGAGSRCGRSVASSSLSAVALPLGS
jgi:hypothetical protein